MRPIAAVMLVLALGAGLLNPARAQQNLPVPEVSPRASVSQTVGLTEVSVTYHRPGVKGRAIWGGLVPYDQVWRAGANENTTVSFSGPVRFGGKDLAAGTYGLHMIPSGSAFTIILSSNATSWGSYFYRQDEDVCRFTTQPKKAPFQEWLSYQFTELTPNGAALTLRWGELEIPMTIEVDVHASVVKHAREVYLRGMAGFSWQGWYQAANYCAIQGVNLAEAMTWIDRSIRMNRNFTNLWAKGALLERAGKKPEAASTKQEALAMADEAAINALGYEYLGGGNVEGALELFTVNVEKYPASWNVYDSLGEGSVAAGNKELAIANYTKALGMTSDEAQKSRIRQVLKTLGAP